MHPLQALGIIGFPPLFAVIAGAFAYIAPFIVKYIIVGLGVSVVSYVGLNVLLDFLQNQVVANLGGLTGVAAQIVGLTKLDDAIVVVMSAWAAKVSVLQVPGAIRRIRLMSAAPE